MAIRRRDSYGDVTSIRSRSFAVALSLALASTLAGSAAARAQALSSNYHLTLTYEPTVLAAGSWFRTQGNLASGDGLGIVMHNVGADLALGSGTFRYHIRVTYSDLVESVREGDWTASVSLNGVRFDPLELGWVFRVYRAGPLRLSLEPTASLLEMSFYSERTDGTLALLGAGIGVGLIVDLGALHFVIKPINLDIIYLASSLGTGDSTPQTDGNLMYRFGIGVGLNL